MLGKNQFTWLAIAISVLALSGCGQPAEAGEEEAALRDSGGAGGSETERRQVETPATLPEERQQQATPAKERGKAQQPTETWDAEETEQAADSEEKEPVEEQEQREPQKLISANPLDLSQVSRISKFRSCTGHDYSGLNADGEKETNRSMKHYIDPISSLEGSTGKFKAIAPFNGYITEVGYSDGRGNNVLISPTGRRFGWQIVLFHIDLIEGLDVGSSVKAGEVVGYGNVKGGANFDIALKYFGFAGEIFESPFSQMAENVLKEYEAKGVTPGKIIFTKEERDKEPCTDWMSKTSHFVKIK